MKYFRFRWRNGRNQSNQILLYRTNEISTRKIAFHNVMSSSLFACLNSILRCWHFHCWHVPAGGLTLYIGLHCKGGNRNEKLLFHMNYERLLIKSVADTRPVYIKKQNGKQSFIVCPLARRQSFQMLEKLFLIPRASSAFVLIFFVQILASSFREGHKKTRDKDFLTWPLGRETTSEISFNIALLSKVDNDIFSRNEQGTSPKRSSIRLCYAIHLSRTHGNKSSSYPSRRVFYKKNLIKILLSFLKLSYRKCMR